MLVDLDESMSSIVMPVLQGPAWWRGSAREHHDRSSASTADVMDRALGEVVVLDRLLAGDQEGADPSLIWLAQAAVILPSASVS